MLIKDVTFLKNSQRFNLEGKEQKRVDLVLVKLIQPQRPPKIRPSFFFTNTSQKIFSLRRTQPNQLQKCYDRFVTIRGKTILRGMILYKKSRPTAKAKKKIFCDQAIYGTTLNPITQIPIFNAHILLYPLKCSQPLVSTMSNASGHYLIESIPAGVYRLTASKPGYYIFRAKCAIASNRQFSAIDIQLLRKPTRNCKGKARDKRMEYQS